MSTCAPEKPISIADVMAFLHGLDETQLAKRITELKEKRSEIDKELRSFRTLYKVKTGKKMGEERAKRTRATRENGNGASSPPAAPDEDATSPIAEPAGEAADSSDDYERLDYTARDLRSRLHRTTAEEKRLKIYDYLKENVPKNGPCSPRSITVYSGVPLKDVKSLLQCNWFEKDEDGDYSIVSGC